MKSNVKDLDDKQANIEDLDDKQANIKKKKQVAVLKDREVATIEEKDPSGRMTASKDREVESKYNY